jgi:flavorubredoxin
VTRRSREIAGTEKMRDDLVEIVERELDRKVIAFMSQNHIDPDLAVEVFVLQPADAV